MCLRSNLFWLYDADERGRPFHQIEGRYTDFSCPWKSALHRRPGRLVSGDKRLLPLVVGPSGCGKSTVLNLVAGLMAPAEGTVEVFGYSTARPLIDGRPTCFNRMLLLPWKSVLENVMLGLSSGRRHDREAPKNGRELGRRVGLGIRGCLSVPAQRRDAQRVAMAQCWIVDPDLLMDEPFGALDVHTSQRWRARSSIFGPETRADRPICHSRPGRGHRAFRRSRGVVGRPREPHRGIYPSRSVTAPPLLDIRTTRCLRALPEDLGGFAS